jgi:hypothetical protein
MSRPPQVPGEGSCIPHAAGALLPQLLPGRPSPAPTIPSTYPRDVTLVTPHCKCMSAKSARKEKR